MVRKCATIQPCISLEIGNLTENIYLNARAADKAEDTALADFLCYMNSGKAGSKFTQAIDAETKRVINDKEWRERYVTWEMDLKIIQENWNNIIRRRFDGTFKAKDFKRRGLPAGQHS